MPNLSEQGYILAAGKALEYVFCDEGNADGPAIVLLHEGLGCCSLWKEFPQALAKACDLQVIAYSRAGYGRSESHGLPWPVSYMHDEALITLPAFLAAAGITDCVLVGHSDGASISTIFAGGAAPGNIRGLVLMAPHFFVEDISISSIAAARQAYETGELKVRLERFHGINTDEAFYGWNGAWLDPEFRDWDITGYLQTISAPVLGIQGTDDEYGTSAQLDAIENHCTPPFETVFFDNCGHFPHREQTDRSLEVIAKFVAQL